MKFLTFSDPTMKENLSQLHFFGDIGMNYCGKRRNTKKHTYGPEIRSYYLFVFVNDGNAVLSGKKKTPFGKNDMLIMFPDHKYKYSALTDWSISWVGLYGKSVDDLVNRLGVTPENPIIHINLHSEIETVLEDIYKLTKTVSFENDLKITSHLFNFFSLLFLNQNIENRIDVIQSALKIIDYNYSRSLSVEEIARGFGYNESYFSRLFKKKTSLSPKQYILAKRMERAQELLKGSDAKIKEVATSVGFQDPLYFSKQFKKHFGYSPNSLIKRKSE